MEKILSKSNRVPEIELIKIFAIVTMIFTHIFGIAFDGNLKILSDTEYLIGFFIVFFGGLPCAPAFIFAMGWGAFFYRGSPKKYLKRFPQLILLGIFVNFFENLVRTIIAPEIFGTFEENFIELFSCDIYFFAALASIYFFVMKIFQDNPKISIAISLILLAICESIRIYFGFEQNYIENPFGDVILDLFIREETESYFPFTSWIIFPILGYFSANFYKNLDDRKKFFRFSLISGIFALIISYALMEIFGLKNLFYNLAEFDDEDFYAMHPAYAICAYGLIAIEICIFSLVMKKIKNLPQMIANVSKNVMSIYVIQWMVIGTLAPQIYFVENIYILILISSAILIFVCVFAEIFNRFKKSLS